MYTAIIPTRAADPYLDEALASVHTQSLAPEEVLVLVSAGDGSIRELSERVTARTPRASVIEVPDPGMIAALNFGIARVSTAFVAFLDSDDLWRPEKQERQMALLEERRDIDAAYGLAVNFTCEGDDLCLLGDPMPSRMFTSTTFRTSVFSEFTPIDPTATHYTWLYRWWASAQALGIRTAVCDYFGLLRRIHSTNSWRVGNTQAKRELFSALRALQAGDTA